MVQQKDEAIAKQQRRAMAQLLEQGKIESAKIRVENIIRSDMNTELLEIIELYCELLSARVGLLEGKECDPDLEEAVKSIIYAAPKVEGVKELGTVRQLLAEKFGKEFTIAAMEQQDKVPERVIKRTAVKPPAPELVEQYLVAIADVYSIDYPPGSRAKAAEQVAQADNGAGDDNPDGDDGGQKEKQLVEPAAVNALNHATPPTTFGPKSPVSVAPPSASTDNMQPTIKLPGPPELKPAQKMIDADTVSKTKGPGGAVPSVDDLQKRFAQLKR